MSSFFRKQFGAFSSSSSNKNGPPTAKSSKSASSGRSVGTLLESGGDSDVNSLAKIMGGASLGYIPKYMTPTYLEQSILSGDIRKYVALPKYVSREEWISSHVFEFFHLTNSFYESISEYCTERKCGMMTFTRDDQYLKWTPEHLVNQLLLGMPLSSLTINELDARKKGTELQSASSFLDFALTWIDQQLEDPEMFPTRFDGAVRPDFEKQVARPIFTLLYVTLYHVYTSHFDAVITLGQVGHLNALFAHFMAFSSENSLIPTVDLLSLQQLAQMLIKATAASRDAKDQPRVAAAEC